MIWCFFNKDNWVVSVESEEAAAQLAERNKSHNYFFADLVTPLEG